MNKKLRALIIILLISIGLLDIYLRYRLCNEEGLIYAIHDPGKTIFHLIILPLGFYLFAIIIPKLKILYKNSNKNIKRISCLLGIILLLLAFLIFYQESITYCFKKNTSYLPPHEIIQKDKRDSLIKLRSEIYSLIVNNTDSIQIRTKKQTYLEIVGRAKDNKCGFKFMTAYHVIAFTGTILGVLFGMVVFFTMFITVIGYRTITALDQKRNLLDVMSKISVIGFLLASEILFRTYSEYYINFLNPGGNHLYNVILIAIVLILFTLFYLLRTAGNKIKSWFTIGYAFLGSLIAFGKNIEFLHINSIMKEIYSWNWIILLMIYIVLLLPLIFIIALDDATKMQAKEYSKNNGHED